MSKKEAIFLLLIVVVVGGGFYYYMKYVFKPANKPAIVEAAAGTAPAETASPAATPANTTVIEKWTLPGKLKEISANVLLDDHRMACVQDNAGIIYIYNLQSKSIDKEIKFADKGDFEGLAKVGNTLYVLRSDGVLYEVQHTDGKNVESKSYDLPLDIDNDTESMCYDSIHNRLLIGTKEKDLHEKDKKGFYSFDLTTKKMSTKAALYLDEELADEHNKSKEEGKDKKKKKGKSKIKPSGVAIHPATGDLYILDGPQSRLIIAGKNGDVQSVINLDKDIFPQPEGLCFDTDGFVYISSEAGKSGDGVIAKMKL